MEPEVLSQRVFQAEDQEWFAALSGDRNPMHLDTIFARRTQAGEPVVHGVHTLLWSLEALCRRHRTFLPINGLKARFDRLIYLNEPVEAVAISLSDSRFRMEARVGGAVALRIAGTCGIRNAAAPLLSSHHSETDPQQPLASNLEDFREGQAGSVKYFTSPEVAAQAYPTLARILGEAELAGLLCLTRIVGMICPGLHSVFGGLTVDFVDKGDRPTGVQFGIERVDPRFRVVRLRVLSACLSGVLETFARVPPTSQPKISALATMVDPAEFAGQKPLVVGGSRGLGEVTAKLLASGGAHVTITFASGLPEAEAVQREIRDAGGKCEIINYDVRRPPNQQLDRDFTNYTHLYYFATPFIFRKKSETFSKSLFESFAAFYVYGFHELCRHLANVSRKLIVFYPSSVAVEMRPPLLTEYAMAKAAGEILCTDLKSEWPCIKGIWSRIPRIRTDQTATMSQVASEDPAVVLLPIIRKLNRAELLPPGINGFVWERA